MDPLASAPETAALRTFVEAVVRHLAFASGEAGDAAHESLRSRVTRLVEMAPTDGAAEDAARGLAADPTVLASFFQNVDLLYEGAGYAHADALAAAVMRAIEMLDEAGA